MMEISEHGLILLIFKGGPSKEAQILIAKEVNISIEFVAASRATPLQLAFEDNQGFNLGCRVLIPCVDLSNTNQLEYKDIRAVGAALEVSS